MTSITIDREATTSNAHGCAPLDRTLEALLEAGMLVIDKPAGPNSHQVSAWARDLLGVEKLGHGGTLDPFATGVLVLLAGRSMRLTKKVLSHDKTYIAVLRAPRAFDADALGRAITQLSGQVYNVVPEISAVKVQVRSRNMKNRLLGVDGRDAVIEIICDAGTYVRTLARDLGLLLGHPIELRELRRTRSGRFSEKHVICLQELADALWLWREKGEDKAIRTILAPVEALVLDLPEVVIKDGAAAAVAHGAPLNRPGIVSLAPDLVRGDTVRLMTMKGELVATASMLTRSELIAEMEAGEVARPEAVFLASDIYPKAWKKSSPEED